MKTMFTCAKNILLVVMSLLLSTSLWAADNNKNQPKPLSAAPRVIVIPATVKPSQMVTLTSSGTLCPSGRGQAVDLALDPATAERFPFFIPDGEALILTQVSNYGSAYLNLEIAGKSTPLLRLLDGNAQLSDVAVGPGAVLCYSSPNSYKNLILQGHLVKND